MKKVLSVIFIAILVLTVSYFSCRVISTKEVEAINLNKNEVELTVTANATVIPKEIIEVVFTKSVVIDKIYVNKGDKVKKGDKLMLLYEKHENGAFLGENEKVIYSPCDGIINSLNVTEQIKISPYKSLAQIYNTENLYLQAYVTESDINKLSVNQTATAKFSSFKNKLYCKIDKIYLSFEKSGAGNSLPIKLIIDNPPKDIIPGFSATVDIKTGIYENAVDVPITSVFKDKENYFVYTIKKGRAVKKQVEIISNFTDRIIIKKEKDINEIIYNCEDTKENQFIKAKYIDYK